MNHQFETCLDWLQASGTIVAVESKYKQRLRTSCSILQKISTRRVLVTVNVNRAAIGIRKTDVAPEVQDAGWGKVIVALPVKGGEAT